MNSCVPRVSPASLCCSKVSYSLGVFPLHLSNDNTDIQPYLLWTTHIWPQPYHAMPCYMILPYYDLTIISCHAMLHDLTILWPYNQIMSCHATWSYYTTIPYHAILHDLTILGPYNHTIPCHATWSYHTMILQPYHAMPCYMILPYYDLTTIPYHAMLHDLTIQPYNTMPY